MNIASSLLLVFLVAVLVSDLPINAAAAIQQEKKTSLRGGAANSQVQRNLNGDYKLKVLVKFKSHQAKQDAKSMNAGEVKYESNRFNIMAMEVDIMGLVELQRDDEIERVELDQRVHAILPIEKEQQDISYSGVQQDKPGKSKPKTKPRRRLLNENNRRLNEEVPWGIRAVQADQVAPGPHANEIKICVVDTGTSGKVVATLCANAF